MKKEIDIIFPLLMDSYKIPHSLMIKRGVENIYSYFESREGALFPKTVFYGLQAMLKKYFIGQVVDQDDIDYADEFCREHFMGNDYFPRDMWEYILKEHGGKLPIEIKAIEEGTPVEISNVLMSTTGTDETINPKTGSAYIAPLINQIDTILTQIWYPCNVSTISYFTKKLFEKAYEVTVDDENQWMTDYMLHDFGMRGATCIESAQIGGSAHLVCSKGTDTMVGILETMKNYDSGMSGNSVAASEHNVMMIDGKEGEQAVVERLIRQFNNEICSIVSDTFSIKKLIQDGYCDKLKNLILNETGPNFKLVVRPDSKRFDGDTCAEQVLWITQELEKGFGVTENSKGYKVLNPKVGIIYGDGIGLFDIEDTVNKLVDNKYAASTCVFGMGGGLLQKHNRDTQRNAFKSSSFKINGKWEDRRKDPEGGGKTSKLGRLSLVKRNGVYHTIQSSGNLEMDHLEPVFRNGKLLRKMTFNEIRENAKK